MRGFLSRTRQGERIRDCRKKPLSPSCHRCASARRAGTISNMLFLKSERMLSFGDFKLKIEPHPHDRLDFKFSLYKSGKYLPEGTNLPLRLLKFLADDHPGESFDLDQLARQIWAR